MNLIAGIGNAFRDYAREKHKKTYNNHILVESTAALT